MTACYCSSGRDTRLWLAQRQALFNSWLVIWVPMDDSGSKSDLDSDLVGLVGNGGVILQELLRWSNGQKGKSLAC